MKKGHFIVIEGTDGSGKGTQTTLLLEKLQSLNIPSQLFDFPRYDDNEYGKLVGRYLKGEFGGLEEVSPYLASLAYAGDRMLAGPVIKKGIEEGKLVITNRYVLSNKAYMAARVPGGEKDQFLNWLDNLEYGVNKVPREELVIFLFVPLKVSQSNIEKREQRNYLGDKKRDIMEANLSYMQEVEDLYLSFAGQNSNWHLINCVKNGQMRTREEIHQEILKILKDSKII